MALQGAAQSHSKRQMASVLSTVILIVAAAAIWALAHPYQGIRHDGELYLAQALLHLKPELFSGDLFFAYGSQDRFTVFSRLYAWVVDSLGIGPAAWILTIAAQLLFAGLTALLLRRLLEGKLFWLGLALAFSYVPYYGGWFVFSYGEPFVTARSFAEPLCLLALILLIDGRPKASLAAIVAAGLLHPLLALTTACLWWICHALHDRRWWWLGLAGLALPVLASLDLFSVPLLWERYDDQWWDVVWTRNAFVLPTRWTYPDWMNLAADSLIVLLAIVLVPDRRKRFLVAALITGLLGVLATLAGAELMRNVLLTSLQLWRTHWILHLVAVAMLPLVTYELWKTPRCGRALAALVVTTAVATRFPGSAGAMLLALVIFAAAKRGFRLSVPVERLLLAACALAIAAAIGEQLHLRLFGNGELSALDLTGLRITARAVSYPLIALLIMGALLGSLKTPKLRLLGATCVVVLAVLGLGTWDQRTPWLRYIENGAVGDRPFAGLIQPDQQVLWQGEMLATWLLLSHPSWYNFSQGSGVLFRRDNALEFERRKSVVDMLEAQAHTCKLLAGFTGRDECTPDLESIRTACREARDLDFIIIRSGLEGSAVAEWKFSDPMLERPMNFYLYDCKRRG